MTRVVRPLGLVLLMATLLLLAAWPAPSAALTAPAAAADPAGTELLFFWGDGCPYCQAEKDWLEQVRDEYPRLTVREYEVWYDEQNLAMLTRVAADLGFEVQGVPVTVMGERHWVGWSDAIQRDLVAHLEAEPAVASADDRLDATAGQDATSSSTLDVPVVGEVGLGDSLVASTLLIGLVDGMNPCSLWVITVLLAIVVRTGDRRRVFAIGITFLVVTALINGLFVLGVYSALGLVSHLGAVQVLVAVVAGAFGAISIKDYFAFKQGVSMTISDSAKPGLYHRMRRAAGHEALLPALAATIVLAMGASLLEIPCTAGLPLLWAGILEANGVGAAAAVGLLGLYLVPFLLDELIVFTVAVVTMRSLKMQEHHGRLLKLIAGTMMVALAATVLLAPEAMGRPAVALLIFVVAMGAAALIHGITRRARRRAAGGGERQARHDAHTPV